MSIKKRFLVFDELDNLAEADLLGAQFIENIMIDWSKISLTSAPQADEDSINESSDLLISQWH